MTCGPAVKQSQVDHYNIMYNIEPTNDTAVTIVTYFENCTPLNSQSF